MKKPYLLILCLLITACSDLDDSNMVFDINSFPQKWTLTGMSGGLSGIFFTGSEMSWQETITLQNQKRFLKRRQIGNEVFEGVGVFAFVEKEGEMYLSLEYNSETELIENCGHEKLTELFYMPSTSTLTGGSAPCDGPGLYYDRIE